MRRRPAIARDEPHSDGPSHGARLRSGCQQVAKEFRDARVLRLAEPEHGLFANLRVAVVLCDVHQLRERFVVVPLRHDEGEVLAQLSSGVSRSYSAMRSRVGDVALSEPEERLLARLERRVVVDDDLAKRGREIDVVGEAPRRSALRRHCDPPS